MRSKSETPLVEIHFNHPSSITLFTFSNTVIPKQKFLAPHLTSSDLGYQAILFFQIILTFNVPLPIQLLMRNGTLAHSKQELARQDTR